MQLYILLNCDMIKGNESNVTDIDFEILAKKEVKFLCLILFTKYPIAMGFASKCSIFKVARNECRNLNIENLRHVTHFP